MSPPRHKPDDDTENNPKPEILSGATPIQVRFFGWLIVTCAAGFAGSIWWAATMSNKLDYVLTNQANQMASIKSVADDVSHLKEWRIQVDTVGSPEMVKRVDVMRADMDKLLTRFEMHLATTTTATKIP